MEEERRLFYVGVTRARHRLHLSWALARTPGGRSSRKPSRFLDGLRMPGRGGRGRPGAPARGPGPVRAAGAAARPRRRGRLAIRAARGVLRLREWRREAAREQSVPAFVIFSTRRWPGSPTPCPGSLADLAIIPGVGQAKLDRYGAAVIAPRAGE